MKILKIFGCLLGFFSLLQITAHAETIHYSINKMFKVGTAELSMVGPTNYKNKDTLLIVFKADGFNFHDEEKIYVDKESYKPLFVERDVNIFGKKEKISEEYTKGAIHITKVDSSNKTTQQTIQKGGVDNIYGFIFNYRKKGTFKVGDTLDVHLPTKDIKIKLTKQTKVDAAKKTYDSFYMESKPAQYQIWFDTSDKKLPLRISGSVGLANTTMVMTDYSE